MPEREKEKEKEKHIAASKQDSKWDSKQDSTSTIATAPAVDEEETWCINGGESHKWERWQMYTPAKKYKCIRQGCGFFKKCWQRCELADTTCKGCHVIGHKRW